MTDNIVYKKMLCGLFISISIIFLSTINDIYLIGLFTTILLFFLASYTNYFMILLFIFLLSFCVIFNDYSFDILFFNLYGADIVLLLMFSGTICIIQTKFIEKKPVDLNLYEKQINKFILIFFFLGSFSLLHGILSNHPPNDALGMFRRLYIYQLSLFIFINLNFSNKTLKITNLLPWFVFAGSLLVGFYRLINGLTYKPEIWVIQATIPSPRLLSYTEVASFSFCYAYFLASFNDYKNILSKSIFLICALFCIIFMLISGWRLAFIYIVIIPLLIFILKFRTVNFTTLNFLRSSIFIIISLCSISFFTILLFNDLVFDPIAQLKERIVTFNLEDDMRYYMWQNALILFLENPIFGVGLGHNLEFLMRASDGQFMLRTSSTHNTFLTILYQSGIIIFLIFLMIHLLFLKFILNYKTLIVNKNQSLFYALFAFYITSIGFSLVQPLQIGHIVSIHICMTLLLKITNILSHENIFKNH